MGSDGHLVVLTGSGIDGEALARRALARVAELEARWSRFDPASDVSLVNAASPRPVPVAPETVELAARAVEAARETGGRFDATQLPALVAAGYDRTFAEIGCPPIGSSRRLQPPVPGRPVPARPSPMPRPSAVVPPGSAPSQPSESGAMAPAAVFPAPPPPPLRR